MRFRFLLAAVALALSPSAACADTARDMQVIARAVSFVEGLPRGNVDVAVVDGPGADAVMAAIGSGLTGGGVTLVPRRVAVGALAGSGVRVIIVPPGQAGSHAAIASVARSLHAVTLSSDMGCVNAGHCVVGVASDPRVEIVVSRAASTANGVSFAQAFRVMVREV